MTDERKIITERQFVSLEFSYADAPNWEQLPDAPKHTDGEYEQKLKEILWHAEQLGNECRKVAKLEARIKELEGEVRSRDHTCPVCGASCHRYVKEAKR